MMAVIESPSFRSKSSAASAVTLDVMVLPPPTSILIFAEIGPLPTETTVPLS